VIGEAHTVDGLRSHAAVEEHVYTHGLMPQDTNPRRLFEPPRLRDVFSWLDLVQQRPSMFIRDGSLTDLEMLIWGYYAALRVHHLEEGVPEMTRHFSAWLELKKRWSTSLGWAHAIAKHTGKDAQPLDVFFSLVRDYQKLRPAVLCHAALGPQHAPTGKRCTIGVDRLLPPPLKIEVVQYRPEPITTASGWRGRGWLGSAA